MPAASSIPVLSKLVRSEYSSRSTFYGSANDLTLARRWQVSLSLRRPRCSSCLYARSCSLSPRYAGQFTALGVWIVATPRHTRHDVNSTWESLWLFLGSGYAMGRSQRHARTASRSSWPLPYYMNGASSIGTGGNACPSDFEVFFLLPCQAVV
jgi:hypothetical protein